MQIVTDTGMDLYLLPEMMPRIPIHIVRHTITLDGKTYRSGIDMSASDLHRLLAQTTGIPITSQPAPGDFATMYRELAKTDPEILSIHMSSGLSGVINAATAGAQMVPEANITIVDTKILCAVLGWVVGAAARALEAGWSKDEIIALCHRIVAESESTYTLTELKYLIAGGRIGHMKGLIATAFKIKPLIGVEKVYGRYEQLGMSRTLDGALQGLINLMLKKHPAGSALQTQVLHAECIPVAERLRAMVDAQFQCTWMPYGQMSPALAAHTGPSMVGVAYAPRALFEQMP